ncbi:MAG: ABC transporter permease subunit [Clostridia bacterium]|nr:ABC transporter permease subunit [Clostridia bacterium]
MFNKTLKKTLVDNGNKMLIFKRIKEQKQLHLMLLPGIIFLILFNYLPMIGMIMGFQDFKPFKGFLGSEFVGLKHFIALGKDLLFWRAFRNSLVMSLIKLVITFPIPIFFAIILNELRNGFYKKIVQTASLLPHFIAWVVIAGIFQIWLSDDGLVNVILAKMHIITKPYAFLQEKQSFWVLMAIIDAWKSTGWWSVIYLASIAGISIEVYEAALIDGAGRIKRILFITLPYLKNTMAIVFILSMGGLVAGGMNGTNFTQSLLFSNVMNYDYSLVLDTYVVRLGLQLGRLSFAAAVGIVLSVVSLVLFTGTNYISKKINGTSIY